MTVDVVEHAVVGLPHDGHAPEQRPRRPSPDVLTHERVAHGADAEGVGEADRRGERARLAHPLEAGELAVAVEPVRGREHGPLPDVVTRQLAEHPVSALVQVPHAHPGAVEHRRAAMDPVAGGPERAVVLTAADARARSLSRRGGRWRGRSWRRRRGWGRRPRAPRRVAAVVANGHVLEVSEVVAAVSVDRVHPAPLQVVGLGVRPPVVLGRTVRQRLTGSLADDPIRALVQEADPRPGAVQNRRAAVDAVAGGPERAAVLTAPDVLARHRRRAATTTRKRRERRRGGRERYEHRHEPTCCPNPFEVPQQHQPLLVSFVGPSCARVGAENPLPTRNFAEAHPRLGRVVNGDTPTTQHRLRFAIPRTGSALRAALHTQRPRSTRTGRDRRPAPASGAATGRVTAPELAGS
jgi:hypothetical protein